MDQLYKSIRDKSQFIQVQGYFQENDYDTEVIEIDAEYQKESFILQNLGRSNFVHIQQHLADSKCMSFLFYISK